MKKASIALLTLAAAFASVSCQKEIENKIEGPKSMTISALSEGVGTPQSKADLAYRYDVLWAAGDKIQVKNASRSVEFILASGEGTTNGIFSSEGTISGEVEAFYPASIVTGSGLEWPATYKNNSVAPMYSKKTISGTENVPMSFSSLGSILQLMFTTSVENTTLKSIEVSADQTMSGAFHVDASGKAVIDATDGNGLTLDLEDGVAVGLTTKLFYIPIPSGTYTNLTITFTASDGTKCIKKADRQTINFNSVARLALSATSFKNVPPKGTLPGEFSVADGKKVRFSHGNLIATVDASGTPTAWKFAANQYDCLGEGGANKTIGSAAGDVDLFGWSTAATTYGISTSTTSSDYSGAFVDWGKTIGDGSTWRTLSKDEWEYLFKQRTNASRLYKCGVTVSGTSNCLIIAPDGFTGTIETSYDATTWPAAEAAGLVCLPAAGLRSGSEVSLVGGSGHYWLSSSSNSSYADYVYFSSTVYPLTPTCRESGKAVRCILEVPMSPGINATDLSDPKTANCYIVSAPGYYKFKTVKGNTSTSVGSVASASVVWETFGTATAPNVGDLVNTVSCSNGYIIFNATGTEGNALIAAKDASGNILWSWHIWCTDKPSDQVYNNDAGSMMDRNLGATSATPGDVGALGLLYQWGRKDPFLGSSSISSDSMAASTITWPSTVASDSSNGTIAYATAHPTTFIKRNQFNYDWYFTGSSSTDDSRWNSSKGTYDPCPPGYRVPDGGDSGVWSKALGSSSSFSEGPWYSGYNGCEFSKYFTKSDRCWYPASGDLAPDFDYSQVNDLLEGVGSSGQYWSCTPCDNTAYYLYFNYSGQVIPSLSDKRASGNSVRCVLEGSMSSDINVSSVSLNNTSLTLTVGDTETLTATVNPSNATNKNVSWQSSNSSVATVSSTGKVTAVQAGSTTITVTTEDGGKAATCSVTVMNATDLSASGTANCYIVSSSGTYKFKTVKGNTSTSVGSVSSASVVWETFGTATAPNVGDLVNTVSCSNGYIIFNATGTEGNALIAAKDASGNILWSWHIWCTDKPSDQGYKNGAGTMMDRNLGATSVSPGDVGALGLLYQWGRKDPFLGSSSISSDSKAASTITWPSAVASDSSNGTIAYATAHPTTFITNGSLNYDWYFTGSSSTDDTRWSSSKGTYDPCPPGYRVPDGGNSGVWSKALGSSSSFSGGPCSSDYKGYDFLTYFTSGRHCWYPASGHLGSSDGSLHYVGSGGSYWSCTPYYSNAYSLVFDIDYPNVDPSLSDNRASGNSVRCLKE